MFFRVALLLFSTLTFECACIPRIGNLGINTKPADEILFVSSQDEIWAAGREWDTLKGIAISVNYYKKAPAYSRQEIDGLVKHVLALKYRPVFLYGQPFDGAIANKLLAANGKVSDGSRCSPTAWALIMVRNKDTAVACGGGNLPPTEENLRKWISSYWSQNKKNLLKNK